MPAAKEGQKLCTVCGQDVSGKPRVKDPQGRYVCAGECQQKLAASAGAKPAAKPAAAAPAVKAPPMPAEDDVMGRLINASPMINALNCGECGAPMTSGSVVCVRCGHNTQTGKSLKTAVVKVKEEKKPKATGGKYENKYAEVPVGLQPWHVFAAAAGMGVVAAIMPFVGQPLIGLIIVAVLGLATFFTVGWTLRMEGDLLPLVLWIGARVGAKFYRNVEGAEWIFLGSELVIFCVVMFMVESRFPKVMYAGSFLAGALFAGAVVLSGSGLGTS